MNSVIAWMICLVKPRKVVKNFFLDEVTKKNPAARIILVVEIDQNFLRCNRTSVGKATAAADWTNPQVFMVLNELFVRIFPIG